MTRALSWIFSFVALAAIVLLAGIFAYQSLPVWHHEGWNYVTGAKWFFRQKQFGALPMIYGTVVVALIALVLAAPLGFGAAICTAEYLPRRARLAVKVLIEMLAGVPSVVYGLLGILLLRDWIYDAFAKFEPLSGDTLLTAGVLLAVMILPTIVTLSDDALRGVPAAQRRAARGLGLTRAETILSIAIPQAKRGLGAALLARAGPRPGRDDRGLPRRGPAGQQSARTLAFAPGMAGCRADHHQQGRRLGDEYRLWRSAPLGRDGRTRADTPRDDRRRDVARHRFWKAFRCVSCSTSPSRLRPASARWLPWRCWWAWWA